MKFSESSDISSVPLKTNNLLPVTLEIYGPAPFDWLKGTCYYWCHF